jgi:hypothetical protein
MSARRGRSFESALVRHIMKTPLASSIRGEFYACLHNHNHNELRGEPTTLHPPVSVGESGGPERGTASGASPSSTRSGATTSSFSGIPGPRRGPRPGPGAVGPLLRGAAPCDPTRERGCGRARAGEHVGLAGEVGLGFDLFDARRAAAAVATSRFRNAEIGSRAHSSRPRGS